MSVICSEGEKEREGGGGEARGDREREGVRGRKGSE